MATDIIKATRGGYVTMLGNAGVAVYDRYYPDSMTDVTYAVITTQSDEEVTTNKCNDTHRSEVEIEVIHRTMSNSGGVFCDDVAGVIIDTVKGDNLLLEAPYIVVAGSSRKIRDTTSDSLSDTFRVYRRIVRFQHIIKQN